MLTTLAHRCVRRRHLVLVAWLALLIALGGALGGIGSAFTDSTELPTSHSATAYELLGRAGSAAASGTPGTIVWHTASGSAVGGSARTAMTAILARVAAVDGVASVSSPFDAAGAAQVSSDGRTAYATVLFDDKDHTDRADDLAHDAEIPGLTVQPSSGSAWPSPIWPTRC